MTTTPTRPASTAPVPWVERQEFQKRIRGVMRQMVAVFGEGWEECVAPICQTAEREAHMHPWVTVDDVAAELAHHLGAGWGALYRVWVHQDGCLCWEGWVSHSEVGRVTRTCLLHRSEGDDVC